MKRTLRKALSLLLAALMLLSVSTGAFALGGNCCAIGSTGYGSVSAALAAAHEDEDAANPTVIRLTADTAECITVPAERFVTLDLNDHFLMSDGGVSPVINFGTLTIMDTVPEGTVRYWETDPSHGCWKPAADQSAVTDKCTRGGVITGGFSGCDLPGVDPFGAGIYNTGTLNVAGGSIAGNGGSGVTYGGGIYNAGTLNITGGSITANQAYTRGGGVYNTATLNITGGSIEANQALNGGGVYNEGTLNIAGGSIEANSGTGYGGGIYSEDTLIMSAGQIYGNSSGNGGGIYSVGKLTVSGGEISGNTASHSGGGINASPAEGSQLTITGGSVTRNTANVSGGGVIVPGQITLGGGVRITGNTDVAGNASDLSLSGTQTAVISTEKPLTSYASVGVRVSGTADPSAPVRIAAAETDLAAGCFFSDSSDLHIVYNAGVGQYELSADEVCRIGETGYASVTAALNSVAVEARTVITLTDDVKEDITVPAGRSIVLDLNDHVFRGTGAGSVITNNGSLEILDTASSLTVRFWAEDNGQWIPVSGETQYRTEGGVITGGTGTGAAGGTAGGGIYNNGNLTVSGGSIAGNHAAEGGGIANFGALTLNGGTVCCNAADFGGGIANCDRSTMPGMAGTAGEMWMNNATVCRNTAVVRGGGVYNEAALTMGGGEISENTVNGGDGGGVANKGTLVLTEGSILENTARNGGGIMNEGGSISIQTFSLIIFSNIASGDGGGIYNGCSAEGTEPSVSGLHPGILTIDSVNLYDNSASGNGGGIHNKYGNMVMTGGSVYMNTAGGDAGGVCLTDISDSGQTYYSSLTLGGGAAIIANTAGTDDHDSNLCLDDGQTVTISETALISFDEPNIGVTLKTPPVPGTPVAVTANGKASDAASFCSDNDAYYVCAVDASGAVPAHLALAARIPQTVTASDVSAVYGDTDKKITASADGGGVLSYSVSSGDAVSVNASGELTILKAGSSVITVAAGETAEYFSTSADVTVTVAAKEVTLNWAGTELSYTGSEQAPTATAEGLVGDDSCTVTVTGAAKETGTHTATAAALSNPNYVLPADASVEFRIVMPYIPPAENKEEPIRFIDVDETDWFYDAVNWAVGKDITTGTDPEHFSPFMNASRAQVITFLWRLAGKPAAAGTVQFTDVAEDAYYTDAVQWAVSGGIIKGTGAATADPDADITREQLAVMLYNYAKTKGEGLSGDWMFALDFDDADEISEWADEAMHWCVMKGILKGIGNNLLAPGRTASRAEIVTMLYRYFK